MAIRRQSSRQGSNSGPFYERGSYNRNTQGAGRGAGRYSEDVYEEDFDEQDDYDEEDDYEEPRKKR